MIARLSARRGRMVRRGLIATVALSSSFGLATSTPMAASLGANTPTADPNVQVTNTETVQARLDSSGKVEQARVYEQLSFTGKGKLKVSNPVSKDGLRNLDGFGDFTVQDGKMVTDVEVDGERRMRAVSDFEKSKLPLKISVEYSLDGKPIKPGNAVGKTGTLAAKYRVENTSAQPRPISLKDGLGRDVSEQADVVIPLVGQLATVLPSEFTDVQSKEANKAGDGKGGTKLSFTVTLFPPIGNAVAEFGWSARVRDAVIPPAELTALPVSPLESPTFATGVTGYTTGAKKGADLASGGTTIDSNLTKLRDGANKLLSGLLQMNAGAEQLRTGLADRAAPGASQLAGGARDLRDGLTKLDNGADLLAVKLGEASTGGKKLRDGSGKLNDGAKKVDDGAKKLKDGQRRQNDGATQLKKGVGDLNTGTKKLKSGTSQAASGANKLKAGTNKANAGSRDLKSGTARVSQGAGRAAGSVPALITGLGQVKGGLEKVEQGLIQMYGGIGQLPEKAKPLHEGIAKLKAGIGSKGDESTLLGGLERLKDQLAASGPGIDRMLAGVYRESDDKATAGAYQKIGCAVEVVKALRDGKAAGSFNNPHDRFCYGPQWALLNVVGIPAEPDASAVRKTVMASLTSELAAGRQRLADPDNLVPDLDKPLPDDATLQLGLAYLKGRLTERAVPGIVRLQCGLDSTSSGSCDNSKPGLMQGLALADAGISQLVSSVVNQIQGAIGQAGDTPVNNTLRGGINGLKGGVGQIHAGGQALLAGLVELADGAGRVDTGMGQLAGGIGELNNGAGDLASGVGKLDKGAGDLSAGMGKANTGIGKLANGAGQLYKGQSDLAGGTGQLRAGHGVLVKGTKDLDIGLGLLMGGGQRLAKGTGDASDGSQRLATGAGDLSTGIGTAADGMNRLADGLNQASKSGPQLPNGLQRLSNEGAKKLVRNGQDTAIDFGRRYALMAASAERAKSEGMPFGAPEGAAGATAYSFKLAGATGESGRNIGRLFAALGVFAVALGITGFIRRRLA